MAMSTRSGTAEGQIDAVLDRSKCSFDDLVHCEDLISQFCAHNPRLMEFMKKEKNLRRIFEMMHTDSSLEMRKIMVALFQTSNTILCRILADSIPILELALGVLDEDTPNSIFAYGIASEALAKAFYFWPEDVADIFCLSSRVSTLMTLHVDKICVLNFMHDKLTEANKGMWLWLWHSFVSMVPVANRSEYRWRSRELSVRESMIVAPDRLTAAHRSNLMTLMAIVFRQRERGDLARCEFRENVLRWLKTTDSRVPEFYVLAATLEPDTDVKDMAMKCFGEARVLSGLLVSGAAMYFEKCVQLMTSQEILQVMFAILTRPGTSNIVMQAMSNLLVLAVQRPEIIREGQRVVAYAHNHLDNGARKTTFPFIAKFYGILGSKENAIPRWCEFYNEVLELWHCGTPYKPFTFNEEDMPDPSRFEFASKM